MAAHRTFDREHVASLVLEAIDLELQPCATLMDVLDVPQMRARYMIKSVRDDGLLGVAPHYPTRALIHRGSPNSEIWRACGHCKHPWPCDGGFPYGKPAVTDFKAVRKKKRISSGKRRAPRPRRPAGDHAGAQ